jgi:hypothetical protein
LDISRHASSASCPQTDCYFAHITCAWGTAERLCWSRYQQLEDKLNNVTWLRQSGINYHDNDETQQWIMRAVLILSYTCDCVLASTNRQFFGAISDEEMDRLYYLFHGLTPANGSNEQQGQQCIGIAQLESALQWIYRRRVQVCACVIMLRKGQG